ncbi:Na+/H+ antiporter subunit G [Xylanibacillus composti]|nr:monovalent cation/H(+) antiporter subunit G [Xylanibacillus composti]MDT9725335.1 Na+/H+ antiporter subunit G [Xylanibacillus composti]
MSEVIAGILIISGTILSLLSSLGLLRLPDVYTRSHAGTKSVTLGLLCILMGAFLYFLIKDGFVSIRLLLGIVFVFLTAPVAGHLIARSAYRSGVKLADISVKDELRDDKLKLEQQKTSDS